MSSRAKSPWILHYDASSCNGCDIETLACLTPLFDVERLGVVNTGNPKHADIFIVTGAVNEQSKSVIENLYRQLPEPKVVVAVGACASSGGIFRDCYNISGGVDVIVPVDVYVPGCAARPEAIIDGVVKGLAVMEEKHELLAAAHGQLDQILYARAEKADIPFMLALLKMAAQGDARLHGDDSFPVLQQTPEELAEKFDQETWLKAVVNGKVIGTISASSSGDTATVNGPAVHPIFQNRGIGRRLLKELEATLSWAKEFVIRVANKNEPRQQKMAEAGYQPFKTEVFTPKISWVYLQKERI